jgi:hypothetical protein
MPVCIECQSLVQIRLANSQSPTFGLIIYRLQSLTPLAPVLAYIDCGWLLVEDGDNLL